MAPTKGNIIARFYIFCFPGNEYHYSNRASAVESNLKMLEVQQFFNVNATVVFCYVLRYSELAMYP